MTAASTPPGSESSEFLRERRGGDDAVVQPHAAERMAEQVQARVPRQVGVRLGDQLGVAERVLRDGVAVARARSCCA